MQYKTEIQKNKIMKNPPPSFEQIMEFNQTLLPRFREDFVKGNFTQKEVLEFLEQHSAEASQKNIAYSDDYVIFIQVPEKFKKIVTDEHAYRIDKKNNGQYCLSLDNDYTHWIDVKYFRPCPVDEVHTRSDYTNNHFAKK